jgi:hypothetical protein
MASHHPNANTAMPSGLASDEDAALLLKKLGATIAVVATGLIVFLFLTDAGIRPAAFLAVGVGGAMLFLVYMGHLGVAAYTHCWGLLAVGALGMYRFGLRSTGTLVLPLTIMAGGWLIGVSLLGLWQAQAHSWLYSSIGSNWKGKFGLFPL